MSSEFPFVNKRNSDAHDMRVALCKQMNDLLKSGKCCCWSEVYAATKNDVLRLADKVGQTTAYVFACLVDDVEADTYED